MKYIGSFTNKSGQRIYITIITNNDASSTYNITDSSYIRFAEDPVEIECKASDMFEHVICSSCKIRFVSKEFLGTKFYSANIYDTQVKIGTLPTAGDIWSGYVEPGTYNQPFANEWDEFELNCIDYLATLQYFNYKDVNVNTYAAAKNAASITSMMQILQDIVPYTVYWDESKKISAASTEPIFSETSISSMLFFGDTFDDIWTKHDVLHEVLQYFNLHMVTYGDKFFMFDWNSMQKGTTWTPTLLYSLDNIGAITEIDNRAILLAPQWYSSDSTNLSIADVYNKISLTCKLEELETVIESPLSSDSLSTRYPNKELYLKEYIVEGTGKTAKNAMKDIVSGKGTTYSGATIKDWYVLGKENENWTFKPFIGYDNDQIQQLVNMGTFQYTIQSNLYGVGSIKGQTVTDNTVVNKVNMSDYLIISVNGNGNDTEDQTFPDNSVLQSSQPIATYNGNVSGNFSPNDAETTNYLVFSGKIAYVPLKKMSLAWDQWSTMDLDSFTPAPVKVNGKDCFYTLRFMDGDKTHPTANTYPYGWVPFTDNSDNKLLEYKNKENVDAIKKLDVLECQLKIGDKYCVETYDSNGNSVFGWYTASNLPMVYDEFDKQYYKRDTFSIGINPAIGDFIIGQEYDFANNISLDMNLDYEGIAIPIKQSDNLSGTIEFKILGPVNVQFDEWHRRHKTWFRSTKWSSEARYVLAHASSIVVKDFECIIASDNAKNLNDGENDLIYTSATNEKYFVSKDDIEFKFNTGLTSQECTDKGIKNGAKISSVLTSGGSEIMSIYDANTGNEGKAEELYIDQYYSLHNKPRIMLETEIHINEMADIDTPFLKIWGERNTGKRYMPTGYTFNPMNCRYDMSMLEVGETDGTELNVASGYPDIMMFATNPGEDPGVVKVTGIKLNKTELTLPQDYMYTLIATVLPENATTKNVIWESSNTGVATVDGTGMVKAIGDGECIITATTVDGGHKATCTVNVDTALTSIILSETEITIARGETHKLDAIILPANATNKTVIWSSTSPTIASVDNTGLVTGIREGISYVSATSETGELTAKCKVTVLPASLNSTSLKFIAKNESVSLGFENNSGVQLYYTMGDNDTWHEWDGTTLTVGTTTPVYIKGTNETFNQADIVNKFTTSGNGELECYGNALRLLGEEVSSLPHPYCFKELFAGCTNLTVAPELPATTLTIGCYESMFEGCTNLAIAPDLPAETLVTDCYKRMFNGCSKLDYIKALFMTEPGTPYTDSWVEGVAEYGTFVRNSYSTWFLLGIHGIPTKWVILGHDESYIPAQNVSFEKDVVVMLVGEKHKLKVNVEPENYSPESLLWEVEDSSIADLDEYGTVTAKKLGTTNITVKTKHFNVTATCKIIVETLDEYVDIPAVMFKALDETAYVEYESESSIDMKYSYNKTNWTQWDGTKLDIEVGVPVYVKGVNETLETVRFVTSGGMIKCVGNLCHLYVEGFQPEYSNFLQNGLFQDCKNLAIVPKELYINNMTGSTYNSMFRGCINLINAPELPATTLSDNCYAYMFYGCESLRIVQFMLPATELKEKCYASMFKGCADLINAPYINANQLADSCCSEMYANCTSLVSALYIPATTLAPYCYEYMYSGCTGLETVSHLPATTLAEACYSCMFEGCENLKNVPCSLPATKLATRCYESMFQGCTSLNETPSLPASTLVESCYEGMFSNCKSLKTAPELLATSLVPNCYSFMFYKCNSLNHIKALFTTTPSEEYTNNWVYEVAETGTFIKNSTATWNVMGVHGVPEGWVLRDENDNLLNALNPEDLNSAHTSTSKVFTLTCLENPVTVQLTNIDDLTLEYTLGEIKFSKLPKKPIQLKPGDSIYFRGKNKSLSENSTTKFVVSGSGKLICGGDIMSLLDGFKESRISDFAPYAFAHLFEDCTQLIVAPNLPQYLTVGCFESMFKGCINLTNTPELPATTLTDYCYKSMFEGCISLTTIPELSATKLAKGCYEAMFAGCTKINQMPKLPATQLTENCYSRMFKGCVNLEGKVELQAVPLEFGCYNEMFDGCAKINFIRAMFITPVNDIYDANNWPYTYNWVKNVAATGTFIKNINAEWDCTGVHGIPTGWNVLYKHPLDSNYAPLCFESTGTTKIQFKTTRTTLLPLYVSTDNCKTWNKWDYTCKKLKVTAGTPLYLKGHVDNKNGNIGQFLMEGDNISCTGDIESLLRYGIEQLPENCFSGMFKDCTQLTSAPNISMAQNMQSCFEMFSGCTNLGGNIVLNSSHIAARCYAGMFKDTKITSIKLPVVNADEEDLDNCYKEMLQGCYNLNRIEVYLITRGKFNLEKDATHQWVGKLRVPHDKSYTAEWLVPTSGTFIMNSNADWIGEVDVCGIPEGWDVQFVTVDDDNNNSDCNCDCCGNDCMCEDNCNCGKTLEPTGITLNVHELTIDDIGVSYTLVATVVPEDADDNVIWYSQDENICKVDHLGNVTFLAIGETYVVASTSNKIHSDKCRINVTSLTGTGSSGIKPTIEFTNDSLSLLTDDKYKLSVTIKPDYLQNSQVCWSTSNPDVAIVDADGNVTCIAPGKAAITATLQGSTTSATCNIDCKARPVTGISIYNTNITYTSDGNCQLYDIIQPTNAYNKNVIWTSSNENVATVTNNGLINVIGGGNTTITVSTEDGGFTDTIVISVIGVENVELNETSVIMSNKDTYTLVATITPENAHNKNVIWTSSDENVATVDANGVVTSKDVNGKTIITVTTEDGGVTDTCEVEVRVKVSGITLNTTEHTLYGVDTYQLVPEIQPTNAYNKTVTWKSSNENVATVDANGVVTSTGVAGNTTITATTEDGVFSATCVCIVEPTALKFAVKNGYVDLGFENITDTVAEFEYSHDGNTWNTWNGSSLRINDNSYVYVRGNNECINNDILTYPLRYNKFTTYGTGKLECIGNIMWLLDNSITEVPANCFYGLFNGCTNLTNASKLILPATTLGTECYESMFGDCISLRTAPELPATTLAWACYAHMFSGCISLVNAPSKLPATTLARECYNSMFGNCTSLTTAPELPATTLADSCYSSMFSGCTALVNAPELPATTLKYNCYGNMFGACTSLTTAPELQATTLALQCYSGMFAGCSSLNYIKMLATDVSASNCLNQWVYGVASTGTFVKNDAASLPIGENGIPEGWTVNGDIVVNGIKFTAVDDSVDLSFNNIGNLNFEHSYDGVTYNNWDGTALTIKPDESVYIRGDNSTICGKDADIRFMTSGYGKLKCEGNIMHLLGIISKIIPAEYCFYGLFENCTNLITAPELPATTLTLECYVNMFNGCTNLITAPELPATELTENCYYGMFSGCTSLTTAPELRATTLTNGCYYSMFNSCTSLTTAPELPATTLANNCYGVMFSGCNKLNYIKMTATNISASDCLSWWVSDVASTGTFVKNVAANLPTGADGIPEGWTVKTDAA